MSNQAGGDLRLDPVASYLSDETRQALVLDHQPRAWCEHFAEPKRGGAEVACDVVKCRRSILYGKAGFRWPIYSPLDSVEETKGKPFELLPGHYFVLKKPRKWPFKGLSLRFSGAAATLPLETGWFPHNAVAFLLEQKLCSFGDITHKCR